MGNSVDIVDSVGLLRSVPLFTGLEEAALRSVAGRAQWRSARAGAVLFRAETPATVLYVVMGGCCRVYETTVDGDVILYRFIGPGQMLGGMAAAGDCAYLVTAEAERDTRLLLWTSGDIWSLMERYPVIARNAMRLMVRRIADLQRRYVGLATEPVQQRVAHVLLRLANETGQRVAEGILVDIKLSRQDIAEMAGTTLYTVSRILNRWRQTGVVAIGRRKVIIRQIHGLMALAEASAEAEDPEPSQESVRAAPHQIPARGGRVGIGPSPRL